MIIIKSVNNYSLICDHTSHNNENNTKSHLEVIIFCTTVVSSVLYRCIISVQSTLVPKKFIEEIFSIIIVMITISVYFHKLGNRTIRTACSWYRTLHAYSYYIDNWLITKIFLNNKNEYCTLFLFVISFVFFSEYVLLCSSFERTHSRKECNWRSASYWRKILF